MKYLIESTNDSMFLINIEFTDNIDDIFNNIMLYLKDISAAFNIYITTNNYILTNKNYYISDVLKDIQERKYSNFHLSFNNEMLVLTLTLTDCDFYIKIDLELDEYNINKINIYFKCELNPGFKVYENMTYLLYKWDSEQCDNLKYFNDSNMKPLWFKHYDYKKLLNNLNFVIKTDLLLGYDVIFYHLPTEIQICKIKTSVLFDMFKNNKKLNTYPLSFSSLISQPYFYNNFNIGVF